MNQEELNQLQSRQLELLQIMSKSDAHAAKCNKEGLSYKDKYPEEYAKYVNANAEYNDNEAEIAAMEAAITTKVSEHVDIDDME